MIVDLASLELPTSMELPPVLATAMSCLLDALDACMIMVLRPCKVQAQVCMSVVNFLFRLCSCIGCVIARLLALPHQQCVSELA